MAKRIYDPRMKALLRSGSSHTRIHPPFDQEGRRYRRQTANTVGGMARRAENSVTYRGRRELNYNYSDNRTETQRRIDRVTGVTPNGQSRTAEIGYRANRLAQAVRTFASQPLRQPSSKGIGKSGSSSSNG